MEMNTGRETVQGSGTNQGQFYFILFGENHFGAKLNDETRDDVVCDAGPWNLRTLIEFWAFFLFWGSCTESMAYKTYLIEIQT